MRCTRWLWSTPGRWRQEPKRDRGATVSTIDPDWLETVRSQYGHCFGCGLDNPIGLQIDDFARDGDTISARFTPRDGYRGFHDILHGGIVATALDEVLAWTAIIVVGTMAVTAKMEMKFRKPAPVEGEYQLHGRLVEKRGKRLLLEASCSSRGEVIAEANALFLATDPVPGPDLNR